MHISLLNCCVSYFIRRLKIGNQLIISAQYAAWSATAQWLFLCERQESLFYLKHVFYFLHTEDWGFFYRQWFHLSHSSITEAKQGCLLLFCNLRCKKNKARHRSGYKHGQAESSQRGSLESYTHTGCEIKTRNVPHLYCRAACVSNFITIPSKCSPACNRQQAYLELL